MVVRLWCLTSFLDINQDMSEMNHTHVWQNRTERVKKHTPPRPNNENASKNETKL